MFRRMILVASVAAVTLMGVASTSSAQSPSKKSDAQSLQKKTPKVGLIPPDQRWWRQVGLQITMVVPMSPAAMQNIEAGDIIVSVNGSPVRSIADLNLLLAQGGQVAYLQVLDCRTGWPTDVMVYPVGGRIGVFGRPVPLSDYRPTPPYPPRPFPPRPYPPQPFPPFVGSQAGE